MEDGENFIRKTDYVRNISLYLKEGNLSFCRLCFKVHIGKWHRCFAPRRCYACKRIKVFSEETQLVFRTNLNHGDFCIRETEKKKCERCETIYANETCQKRHIKVKHCEEMIKCVKCEVVYRQQENNKHECNATSLCHVCFTSYRPENRHYCKMENQKGPSKYRGGICCWDSESKVRSSPSYCDACFKKEFEYLTKHEKNRSQLKNEEKKLLLCSQHKEENASNLSYHEINFIGI